jgi:hypothetical protein
MKSNQSTRTSQPSRFKIKFDGERNIWCIHDTKFDDLIDCHIKKIEAKLKCDILNSGSGFGDWQIPTFMRKTFE